MECCNHLELDCPFRDDFLECRKGLLAKCPGRILINDRNISDGLTAVKINPVSYGGQDSRGNGSGISGRGRYDGKSRGQYNPADGGASEDER